MVTCYELANGFLPWSLYEALLPWTALRPKESCACIAACFLIIFESVAAAYGVRFDADVWNEGTVYSFLS